MLKFENIYKSYAKSEILSDITLSVNKGELVVLIGPSGCGKTTMLKMINRLIRPSGGKIYINGEDIQSVDDIKLRRNIGYVIQQTGLFPHMTVRENIEIIPKLEKIDKQKTAARSIELMQMIGLDPDEYLDRYPTELSGGQQQRIGVARAFALDPDIVLMDEPFSALDPITRGQLQDELVELQSKLHKTIVFVTHDMDEAIKIADRICLLNEGRIVQFAEPDELMKNPADDFAVSFIGKNRIWSSPEYINAKDIMITDPVCASPEVSLTRCIERMRQHKVDSLVILDKAKHLCGIAGAHEIRRAPEKSVAVSQVMRSDVLTVSPDDNMLTILSVASENNYSLISVVDEDNKLQGIITKSTLVTALSQQYIEPQEVLQ